jgi:hypothetical protein
MRALLLCSLLILLAPRSTAAILDFTFSDIDSGTIGGVVFSDAAFTISGELNTINTRPLIHNVGITPDDFTFISISGVGVFEFTTPISFVWAPIESILQLRSTGTNGAVLIEADSQAAFQSWDMGSPLGPVTVTGDVSSFSSAPIETTGGILVLNDEARPITFQASVRADVPEPSSAFLVVFSIVSAVLLRLLLARRTS